MLRQYLVTAQDDLTNKQELVTIKQQRLSLAKDEFQHLNTTLTALSNSTTSCEYYEASVNIVTVIQALGHTFANLVTVVQIFTLTTILVTLAPALAPVAAMLVAGQALALGQGQVTTPLTRPLCMTRALTPHTTDTPPRPSQYTRVKASSHDQTRAVSPARGCCSFCCSCCCSCCMLLLSVLSAHTLSPLSVFPVMLPCLSNSSRIPFHI